MNNGGDFKVEVKAAGIHVYCTNEGQNTVNKNGFGMYKSFLVKIYFNAPHWRKVTLAQASACAMNYKRDLYIYL